MNVLRWLSSTSGITRTEATGEKVGGIHLESCDYSLSHPWVSDECMVLYTALTRARNQLYLIESDDFSGGKLKKKRRGVLLADFALRCLSDLSLTKSVTQIDEGALEMTAGM